MGAHAQRMINASFDVKPTRLKCEKYCKIVGVDKQYVHLLQYWNQCVCLDCNVSVLTCALYRVCMTSQQLTPPLDINRDILKFSDGSLLYRNDGLIFTCAVQEL